MNSESNQGQDDFVNFWSKLNDIFPYLNYRKEQFSIITAIQKASHNTLLIDAETGSGKTAAVLSAILSRKEKDERILIFTKMLGQMDAWFRELGLINDYNRKVEQNIYSLVPMVGKTHICPLVTKFTKKQFSQIGCSLFDCTHIKKFHFMQNESGNFYALSRRVRSSIADNIKKGVGLAEILWMLENKLENLGCPYLALKTALKDADMVITTYPFLLNSKLREILFENMNIDLANTTIIIDEAHNLAKGNIGNLSYKILYRAINEIGSHKVLNLLQNLRGQEGLHSLDLEDKDIQDLNNCGRQYLLKRFNQGSKEISNTIKVSEFLHNHDLCYLTSDKKYTLYLKDPRTILNPMKLAKHLILLSGTFRPLKHFASFLGVPNAKKISVLSEKIGKNRIILTTNDSQLTMRYSERSRERFLYYCDTISQLLKVIPGHTLVFTPNYELTTVFANLLKTKYEERPNQPITKLINEVKSSKTKAAIIAPARGKISEGIEIVQNEKSLISAVIIAGLPYPPPSKSLKEIIKEYSKFWGGEQAANYMTYLQAVVTMRQCLGRMIRSENDVGAWIILDNRIPYMNVFPRAIECKNSAKMIERLNFFFKEHNLS
ncbi:MAG: DEAD/DEAH box helicase family protein [Candidatus Heimdallarchaeota archaeon]|nr:DEAD/DEAH box helicase family protein [Candidatus Heimdallarchaeota archaeon]MCK5298448.1 DEAD/DEAH box helicase family protein [Candidatus Heimdallarchaeota archaeon]